MADYGAECIDGIGGILVFPFVPQCMAVCGHVRITADCTGIGNGDVIAAFGYEPGWYPDAQKLLVFVRRRISVRDGDYPIFLSFYATYEKEVHRRTSGNGSVPRDGSRCRCGSGRVNP